MGYNLYIGELKVNIDPEPGDRVYAHLGVEKVEGESIGAPLNSSDHHLNECWPSYSGWEEFTNRVGLTSLFFEEYEGILAQHPGAYVLTPEILEKFKTARASQRPSRGDEIDTYDNRRLDWLVFWTDWALKNCKVPVFANS